MKKTRARLRRRQQQRLIAGRRKILMLGQRAQLKSIRLFRTLVRRRPSLRR